MVVKRLMKQLIVSAHSLLTRISTTGSSRQKQTVRPWLAAFNIPTTFVRYLISEAQLFERWGKVDADNLKKKNEEKLLRDAMKEKFRVPAIDSAILNSILSEPPNTQQDTTKETEAVPTATEASPISTKPSSSFKPTFVANKFPSSSLISSATSLTLLQQFRPGKEYTNPEIVKR